ncbi:MAG: hypothetical protein MJ063_04715 [Lachnospiraceae bacterium]|nr:hypothetical protein [Lachnospiraceae bacterium]
MSEKIEKDTLKVNYGPIFSKGYGRLFYYLFFNPMLDHTARAVLVYISALLPSSNDLLAWPGVQKIKEVTGAGIHQVQEP